MNIANLKPARKIFLIALSLLVFSLAVNIVLSALYLPDPVGRMNYYMRGYEYLVPKWAIVTDEVQFELIARNIIAGKGFSLPNAAFVPEPTMYREPLYPYFLALIYLMFGHAYGVVIILQKLLVALIVVLTYLISVEVIECRHKEKLAAAIAMLVAINSDLFYYSNIVMSEILFSFTLILFTYILIKAIKSKGLGSCCLAGLFLGISSLCKAILGLYFIIAVLLLFFFWRIKLKYILAFLFFYFAVVSPWVTRNYILFKAPSIGSRVGASLWCRTVKLDYSKDDLADLKKRAVFIFSKTLGKKIYPEYGVNYGHILSKESQMYDRYYRKLRDFLSEQETDQFLWRESMEKIKRHPVKYAILGSYELLNLNSFCLSPGVFLSGVWERFSWLWRVFFKIFFLISIPLFFAGVFAIARHRLLLVLFSLVLYFNFFYCVVAITRSGMRYILPVIPFYLIFILVGLDLILHRFNRFNQNKKHAYSAGISGK